VIRDCGCGMLSVYGLGEIMLVMKFIQGRFAEWAMVRSRRGVGGGVGGGGGESL